MATTSGRFVIKLSNNAKTFAMKLVKNAKVLSTSVSLEPTKQADHSEKVTACQMTLTNQIDLAKLITIKWYSIRRRERKLAQKQH